MQWKSYSFLKFSNQFKFDISFVFLAQVFVKIFDKSGHVSHYHQHREEYEMEVLMFLQKLGLVDRSRKRLSV